MEIHSTVLPPDRGIPNTLTFSQQEDKACQFVLPPHTTQQNYAKAMTMEASLQETSEIRSQVDRIARRFAADPRGPLDGSIHPALKYAPTAPTPPGIEPEVISVETPSVTIHNQRIADLYVLSASYRTDSLRIDIFP